LTFELDGFELVPQVLPAAECERIASRIEPFPGAMGSRTLLSRTWCADIARDLRRHAGISALIPAEHVAVQCTYFEKSSASNWLVAFHQDLGIPVARRVGAPELQGWSEKEGGIYVHAPIETLEQLIAVRIHLDACGPEDGPLRVVRRSHSQGRINAEAAMRIRDQVGEVVCTAEAGAALVMRPMLLHASSKATGTSRRRVLHFLFGPRLLPYGLEWAQGR
jgi:hypothetical protein